MNKTELVGEILKINRYETEAHLKRLPVAVLEGQLQSYRKYYR